MKRLLFIAHRVPYPPDKGERLRAFHEIRILSEHFRVTLATLAHSRGDWASAKAMSRWCEEVLVAPAGGVGGLMRGALSLIRGRSVTEGYFHSLSLWPRVRESAGREPFHAAIGYCSSTLPLLLRTPAEIRIMDLVDADSAKWASYAEASAWPKKWLYRREADAVRELEHTALDRCDAVVLTTEAEKASLDPRSQKIHVVGNGVDVEYFKPSARPVGDAGAARAIAVGTAGATAPGAGTAGAIATAAGAAGAGERLHTPRSLVFTGQMDYWPNVEGVCWFAREVWPCLKREVPDLTFTIVGRNPAKAVRRLAAEPGIAVTGAVPDVRPYLARADIAVVPLRLGRGIQNKVLEAMACGLAVVASPAAVAGLSGNCASSLTPSTSSSAGPGVSVSAQSGQPGASDLNEPDASSLAPTGLISSSLTLGKHLLGADSPPQWQQAILQLLQAPARRAELGRAAREFVEHRYSWPAQLAPLPRLCQDCEGNKLGESLIAINTAKTHPQRPAVRPLTMVHDTCNPTAVFGHEPQRNVV